MLKIYIEWMRAAQDDMILLDDIKNNRLITNLIAFHSQQVIEKSLKAYLEYANIPFKKIHKLQTNKYSNLKIFHYQEKLDSLTGDTSEIKPE